MRGGGLVAGGLAVAYRLPGQPHRAVDRAPQAGLASRGLDRQGAALLPHGGGHWRIQYHVPGAWQGAVLRLQLQPLQCHAPAAGAVHAAGGQGAQVGAAGAHRAFALQVERGLGQAAVQLGAQLAQRNRLGKAGGHRGGRCGCLGRHGCGDHGGVAGGFGAGAGCRGRGVRGSRSGRGRGRGDRCGGGSRHRGCSLGGPWQAHIQPRRIQGGLQGHVAALGRGAVRQALLQRLPAALPAAVQLGGAVQADAGEDVGKARQPRDPGLHLGRVAHLQRQAAVAAGGRHPALDLAAGAGQREAQLAFARLLRHADLGGALQRGTGGQHLQLRQVEHLAVPLALGGEAAQAQSVEGRASRCVAAVARCRILGRRDGSAGGSLQVGVEQDGGAAGFGLDGAADRRAFQLGMQGARADVAQGGLRVPGRGGLRGGGHGEGRRRRCGRRRGGGGRPGRCRCGGRGGGRGFGCHPRREPGLQRDLAATGAHGGFGHVPGALLQCGQGLQRVDRQPLCVPGAGNRIAQVGTGAQAVAFRLDLHLAFEQGGGQLRPERGQVERRQPGIELDQRLGPPRRDLGLEVGTGRGRGAGFGLLKLGRDGQAGGLGRQGAFHGGLALQRDAGAFGAGNGGAQPGCQGRVESHRRCALQGRLAAVVAFGHIDAVDFQLVGAAGVAVVTGQVAGLQRRRARPFDRIDLEGQLDLDRQCQLLQWPGGALVGGAALLDDDPGHVQITELDALVQQRSPLPADRGVVQLDGQRRALVAQPPDPAARADRPAHIPRLQCLARRHSLGHLGQNGCQRT